MDLHSIHEAVAPFFPQYWLGTVMSAAFGAFAGAWINNRIQTKKAVVEELNAIRAARMLCFSTMNRFIGLKRKHVRPTRERFIAAKREYDESKKRGVPHVIKEHFIKLTPPVAPVNVLERYLFEKISMQGRGLAAAVELIGVIDGLQQSLRLRNDLIDEIHKGSPHTAEKMAQLCFGVQNADGVVDDRYRASIEAIFDQTDDCIFYAEIVADDLFTYGSQLRRQNAWKYRLKAPRFVNPDWTAAREDGSIPSRDQYAKWLVAFKPAPTRWQRFRAWLCRSA